MGVFEFLTVAVVFGSIFGYLKMRRQVADKERLDALEKRVALLEGSQPGADLARRVDVLEQIVVVEDRGLAGRIDALAQAPVAPAPAARRVEREGVGE